MRVLVADKFEKSGLLGLEEIGTEVLNEPDLKDEALAARIKESQAEVLVVRSTKVTGEMMEGSKLKLIIRAGAGYNTIDVQTATKLGIMVANCPGKNSHAVAELAMGLIISLDRRIPDNVSQLREGRWNKKEFSKAQGLHGRTLGLIGMGSIGKEMIPRAKAFGMIVLVYSIHLSPEDANDLEVEKVDTIEELARRSEIVSVHTSLRAETKRLLNDSFFSAMRPNSIFVNTSRAEVVDQNALLKAVQEKNVRAGLDVFEGEPTGAEGTYDGPLRTNSNVYCTHHIGASTDQAQEAVAMEVVRIVSNFQATGHAPNVVNNVPATAGR
ncbi:MAG: D-3-phosphoglycerate dehydrogenase / 2-oxoglutarate reductase [Fimbriimonadaceae bacterium]|jgi:D-3-phosphoglycerate dehydrogenase|nr:D-3-phosphoglycerate dehydrogenase / 2-oxoglutarate reductase [Fimbriimonadaceae bacterium]